VARQWLSGVERRNWHGTRPIEGLVDNVVASDSIRLFSVQARKLRNIRLTDPVCRGEPHGLMRPHAALGPNIATCSDQMLRGRLRAQLGAARAGQARATNLGHPNKRARRLLKNQR
jgi:hypothetical protein